MVNLHMSEGYIPFQKQCGSPVRVSVSGFFQAAEGTLYVHHNIPAGGNIDLHVAERALDKGVCFVILEYRVVEIHFQIAEGADDASTGKNSIAFSRKCV